MTNFETKVDYIVERCLVDPNLSEQWTVVLQTEDMSEAMNRFAMLPVVVTSTIGAMTVELEYKYRVRRIIMVIEDLEEK